MRALGMQEIAELFHRFAEVPMEKRDYLIALDSLVGGSDLGITISKGFAAARDAVVGLDAAWPAVQLKTAGAALAKAAQSTMGTLMATAFWRGSVPLGAVEQLDVQALAGFWRAFSVGVALRGRANVSDKTVSDVLRPIAGTLEQQAGIGASISDALVVASKIAATAIDATRLLFVQHGKAAAFQEKSHGNVDAGGTVALILIETKRDFVLDASRESDGSERPST
jgi:phosphoenolpyruvate---glycerone phosphotransferase subunit DhaL